MIEHVLADEDLDETDVQPAPKLMEIVLQNCRGRVDAVVAPYLTLALRRLHASRSPYMQVCVSKLAHPLPGGYDCMFLHKRMHGCRPAADGPP